MPRPRKRSPVTQVHLERVDRRHWRIIFGDGFAFFRGKMIGAYLISEKTLKKLKQQIDKELEQE